MVSVIFMGFCLLVELREGREKIRLIFMLFAFFID